MDGNAALAVLGLLPGASEREIKAAFRRQAKRTHPDLGAGGEAFPAVCLAYDVAKTAATGASGAGTTPAVATEGGPAPAPRPRGRWIDTAGDRRPGALDRIDVCAAPPTTPAPGSGRRQWSFDQHLAAALTC